MNKQDLQTSKLLQKKDEYEVLATEKKISDKHDEIKSIIGKEQKVNMPHQLQKVEIQAKKQQNNQKQTPDPDAFFDDDQNANESQKSSQEDIDQQLQQTINEEQKDKVQGNKEQKDKVQGNQKQGENKKDTLKNPFQTFEHKVDYIYVRLMCIMRRYKMLNLKQVTKLKEGYFQLNIKNKGKIYLKTTDKKEADEAICALSDYIDKLSVIKIQLNSQICQRIATSKVIKQILNLNKKKIIYFVNGYDKKTQLYLGGAVSKKALQSEEAIIKSMKYLQIRLWKLKNTRTYNHIVQHILNLSIVKQNLMAKANIKFAEVKSNKKQKRYLHLLISLVGKKQQSYKYYEELVMQQINQFYCFTFIYFNQKKYMEKLTHPKVDFFTIHQKKIDRSYLHAICLKKDYEIHRKEIIQQAAKYDKYIHGMRFFYNIYPYFISKKEDNYRFFKYPFKTSHIEPYSIVVLAKKGKQFYWRKQLESIKLQVHLPNRNGIWFGFNKQEEQQQEEEK